MKTTLLVAGLIFAAQSPTPGAPRPAPPVPSYSFVELVAPEGATLSFEVPTNTGTVTGELPIERFDVRGLDGRGRFALEVWMNPQRVITADPVVAAFIKKHVLPISRLRVTSSERLPPSTSEDASTEEKENFGAAVWINAGGAPTYRQLRYRAEPDASGVNFEIDHQASLKQLGVRAPPHPFVEVTGPVRLRLAVKLRPKG